ncbi:DUF4255 domain-containing protein [Geodermatophilus sp. SYSU D00766]
MTARAIADITDALRVRLEAAVGAGQVYVGPPVAEDVGDRRLALFLFHVVPNQAMRNEPHLVAGPAGPDDPFVETDAIPLDLRYLLSVFRTTGAGNGNVGDPDELLTLGAAVRALHAAPTIDTSQVPGQTVRVTPEPTTMEDLSRVWGLLPQTSYRTSVVYLASPVLVTLDPPLVGRPVTERRHRLGVVEAPPGRVGAPPLGWEEP